MQKIRKTIPVESYLLVVREADSNIFRIATYDKERISQVRIKMYKVGVPDKINFHKQDLEILYSEILKSYLSKNKLDEKVIKLKEQIERDKTASKGWKTQVKKLEAYLVNLSSIPNEKKSNKKLTEEKVKLIENLQKKLKGYVSDHPQTKKIMVIQEKNEDLKKENTKLKAKLLQVTKEKEDLASKRVVEVSA